MVGAGGAAVELRFDGRLELAGVQVDGGSVLGSGDGEMAKEQGERVAGLLVVLVRARGESGGLYPVLSTAAARWRPAVVFWARGTGMEAPARGVEGGGSLGVTRGEASRQEVAPWLFHNCGGNAAVCRRRGAEEAGRQAGGRGNGLICNFRNFRDLTVNQQ